MNFHCFNFFIFLRLENNFRIPFMTSPRTLRPSATLKVVHQICWKEREKSSIIESYLEGMRSRLGMLSTSIGIHSLVYKKKNQSKGSLTMMPEQATVLLWKLDEKTVNWLCEDKTLLSTEGKTRVSAFWISAGFLETQPDFFADFHTGFFLKTNL